MMSGLMQQVTVDSACHVGVTTLVAVAEVGVPPAINQVVAKVIRTAAAPIRLTVPTHLLIYWGGLEGIITESEDAVVGDSREGAA